MAVRVLLVDDHPVFLEGLAAALGRKPNIQLVGTALTGERGLAAARDRAPDLVVVDYLLPDMTGPDLISGIRSEVPDAVCVVLTASDERDYLGMAIDAGASAFLRKELSVDALYESLALVMGGYQIWPAGRLDFRNPGEGQGTQTFVDRYGLTPGELEVLILLASGRTNAAIARVRGVSAQTVKNQTTNLYRKLAVTSRVEAVMTAARANVLPRSARDS